MKSPCVVRRTARSFLMDARRPHYCTVVGGQVAEKRKDADMGQDQL